MSPKASDDPAVALPPVQPSEGPDFVQLLTPEGQRVSHPDYPLDITDEEIRDLYRDLVLVRRIDTEATALQRQGELGLWAGLLGQEAAQVGAGRALTPRDFAFPTYREHGVAYCKGVDPVTLLGLFRGTSQGGWDPQEHGFGLYTIVIGSQTLHATGYAMGIAGAMAATEREVSPSSVTVRRARATSTRRSSGPACSTRRWSSSARTTSGRSPSRSSGRPGSRSTGAHGLRLSRRPGRRQRRARGPGRDPRGARRGADGRARR